MDPDEALRLAREAAHCLDDDVPDDGNVRQLIDSFRALDEWLSQGGFLPAAWRP